MTHSLKKKIERRFVEEAAKHLGKIWELGPCREHPDFIVTESEQQFGLEVRQVFKKPENRHGSAKKRKESKTQQAVDKLRDKYEAIYNIPLRVRFLGDMRGDLLDKAFDVLIAKDLLSKQLGYQVNFNMEDELRVYVTRALRPDWYSVKDRVGWVDHKSVQIIDNAIKKKSNKLSSYRKNAGPDIRLLLVADRFYNSGKLMLEKEVKLDTRGFQVVYFYSRPESVTVID